MAGKDKYFKVIVVGEQGIGMTSFVRRYAEGLFPQFISKMYGLDYRLKETEVKGVTFKIQVWDKMCNQEYRYVDEGYTSTTDVVCLLYDITNKKSYLEIEFWLNQVSNIPRKLLIGLKCDLEDERQVTRAEAETFANTRDLEFYEVSAKEGTNMDKIMIPHHTSIKSGLHSAMEECIRGEKECETGNGVCKIM